MSSAFSGLKIPELSVDPAEVFKSDNPQLVSVLLDEFELQEQRPFFSGLIPEKQINIALKKSPQLKKLACHLLEAYEINGRRWKHADRRRVLEKAIRLLEKVSNELKGDIQKLENNVKESGKDSEELNKTREKHGEILADMGRAYLHRAKIIRPKGFTIPAKKKESLRKALDFCKEAKARHLAGLVGLEMDRCDMSDFDSENSLEKLLRDATTGVSLSKDQYYSNEYRKAEYYQMCIRLAEIEEDKHGATDEGSENNRYKRLEGILGPKKSQGKKRGKRISKKRGRIQKAHWKK